MSAYTYTIFDANPNTSSGTDWPTHTDIEIEADSDDEALAAVEDEMSSEAGSLNPSDGYEAGNLLHAIVWADDGTIVGEPTYELTHDDLGTEPEPESLAVEICGRMDDGRWLTAGRGFVVAGHIEDCPADLGDEVYEALDDAIDGPGTYTVEVGGREYRAEVVAE
jgi:hypothetical protein